MRYRNIDKVSAAATCIKENMGNTVEILTPKNLNVAKAAFIGAAKEPFAEQFKKESEGDIGSPSFPLELNPQFIYNEELLRKVADGGEKIAEALAIIKKYVIPESRRDEAVLKLIEKRAIQAINIAKAARSILAKDDEATNSALSSVFDAPSKELCEKAIDLYFENNKLTPEEKAKLSVINAKTRNELSNITEIGAEKLSWFFYRAMLYFDVPPWKVKISDNCAAIDVRDINESGEPMIVIPKDRVVTGTKAAELICHEIFCHWRGSANGQKFFREILRGTPLKPLADILAKSPNETHYEGEAKMSDVWVNGGASLPDALTIAIIDFASHGLSFVDVAYQVYKIRRQAGASEDAALKTAWAKTYRILRGITDAAKNKGCYAFTKDAAYFLGYKVAQDHANDELYRLYASMEEEEIPVFASLFPEFAASARSIPFKTLIEHAIDIVLEG